MICYLLYIFPLFRVNLITLINFVCSFHRHSRTIIICGCKVCTRLCLCVSERERKSLYKWDVVTQTAIEKIGEK